MMSNNSIQVSIERIVDLLKRDVSENTTNSYLYKYFDEKNRYKEKNTILDENTKDKKINKKTQDFLSANKHGKTESISAKMLLELCNHNEKCRTPVVEVFSSFIDIDKNIGDLEDLLNTIKKDALIPIKIEIHTGATLYIRYRKNWKKLDYIFFYPKIAELSAVDGGEKFNDVNSGYSSWETYQEAKDDFDNYLDWIEDDYKDVNKFQLSKNFERQYGIFMTEESLDDIMDEHSERKHIDYEHLM